MVVVGMVVVVVVFEWQLLNSAWVREDEVGKHVGMDAVGAACGRVRGESWGTGGA